MRSGVNGLLMERRFMNNCYKSTFTQDSTTPSPIVEIGTLRNKNILPVE